MSKQKKKKQSLACLTCCNSIRQATQLTKFCVQSLLVDIQILRVLGIAYWSFATYVSIWTKVLFNILALYRSLLCWNDNVSLEMSYYTIKFFIKYCWFVRTSHVFLASTPPSLYIHICDAVITISSSSKGMFSSHQQHTPFLPKYSLLTLFTNRQRQHNSTSQGCIKSVRFCRWWTSTHAYVRRTQLPLSLAPVTTTHQKD